MPTLLRMPGIAADTTSAVLTEWQVHQGVSFAQSDVVATVQTDKAQVDIEAEEPGEIVRFLVEPGTRVEVGDAIALQCAPGELIDDPNAAMHALGIVADGDAGVDAPERVFATPLVRRLARAANLDLSTITGTGPNGRIVRRDVEGPRAEHTAAPEPAPAADVAPVTADVVPMAETPPLQHVPAHTDEPHSRIRLATATRLTDS